jgi:hypothetical protein
MSPHQSLLSMRPKSAVSACIVVCSMLVGATHAAAQDGRVRQAYDAAPITITGVTVENGQLFAHGLLGVHPFRTTLSLGARAGAQQVGTECPILDLQLGPINLNLLGLGVATSPICLRVTAIEGGGLLGNLLCAVANLLQRGVPLSDVLQILQAQGRLTLLRNGLTTVLNRVFYAMSTEKVTIAATCDVLNLTLGPIDLNLLGLRVELDNCSGGPVTLDITGDTEGGLLGDLLCALAGELARPAPRPAVVRLLLWRIRTVVGQVIG